MIHYEQNTFTLQETQRISRWETWFMTPVGLFTNQQEAVLRMKAIDFPLHVIHPVAVAVNEDTGLYEIAT